MSRRECQLDLWANRAFSGPQVHCCLYSQCFCEVRHHRHLYAPKLREVSRSPRNRYRLRPKQQTFLYGASLSMLCSFDCLFLCFAHTWLWPDARLFLYSARSGVFFVADSALYFARTMPLIRQRFSLCSALSTLCLFVLCVLYVAHGMLLRFACICLCSVHAAPCRYELNICGIGIGDHLVERYGERNSQW